MVTSIVNIISTVALASSLLTGSPSASGVQPIKPVSYISVEKVKEGNNIEGILKLEKQADKIASTKKVNWPHILVQDPAPKPKPVVKQIVTPQPVYKTVPRPVVKPNPDSQPSHTEVVTVHSTAYTASCEGCTGKTATGINLNANPNIKLIAVDPNVIPLGKRVYVEGYGYAITGDTGGAIHGNRIDIYMAKEQDALNWGVRTVKVTILD